MYLFRLSVAISLSATHCSPLFNQSCQYIFLSKQIIQSLSPLHICCCISSILILLGLTTSDENTSVVSPSTETHVHDSTSLSGIGVGVNGMIVGVVDASLHPSTSLAQFIHIC